MVKVEHHPHTDPSTLRAKSILPGMNPRTAKKQKERCVPFPPAQPCIAPSLVPISDHSSSSCVPEHAFNNEWFLAATKLMQESKAKPGKRAGKVGALHDMGRTLCLGLQQLRNKRWRTALVIATDFGNLCRQRESELFNLLALTHKQEFVNKLCEDGNVIVSMSIYECDQGSPAVVHSGLQSVPGSRSVFCVAMAPPAHGDADHNRCPRVLVSVEGSANAINCLQLGPLPSALLFPSGKKFLDNGETTKGLPCRAGSLLSVSEMCVCGCACGVERLLIHVSNGMVMEMEWLAWPGYIGRRSKLISSILAQAVMFLCATRLTPNMRKNFGTFHFRACIAPWCPSWKLSLSRSGTRFLRDTRRWRVASLIRKSVPLICFNVFSHRCLRAC